MDLRAECMVTRARAAVKIVVVVVEFVEEVLGRNWGLDLKSLGGKSIAWPRAYRKASTLTVPGEFQRH